jgi:hypothetical protein
VVENGWRHAALQQFRRQAFQIPPHAEDLFHVIDRQLSDERSLIRDPSDKSPGLQLEQGFTNGCVTDSQLFGHLALDDSMAGPQLARENGPSDRFDDAFLPADRRYRIDYECFIHW